MKKVRAFTLMELLVGMIVSTIVIGFGYGVYSLIYKQYSSYRTIKKEVVDAMQLNSTLNTDFAGAELISFTDNKLTIDRKNNLSLYYNFTDSYILRKENEITDTFKIIPASVTAGFIFADAKAVVSDLSFDSKVLGEPAHFVFTKQYSAEILMNYEIQYKTNH